MIEITDEMVEAGAKAYLGPALWENEHLYEGHRNDARKYVRKILEASLSVVNE